MKFFKSIFGGKAEETVGGHIAFYQLTDWWVNDFTEEERNVIREIYKPMGVSRDFKIDKGVPKSSFNKSKYEFLNNLCSWFTYKHEIFEKIFVKSEECKSQDYENTLNILNKHFYYSEQIQFNYANREISNHLDLAIDY